MENNISPMSGMPVSGGKGGMLAMSVGLLLIGLVAGYFIGKGMSSSNVTYQTATPMTSPAPADWKTYRNDEYGFWFKYPSTLTISITRDTKYDRLITNKAQISVSLCGQTSTCPFILSVNGGEPMGLGEGTTYENKDLITNSIHMLQRNFSSSKHPEIVNRFYFFDDDNGISYQFSEDTNNRNLEWQTFDTILSTFHFTN